MSPHPLPRPTILRCPACLTILPWGAAAVVLLGVHGGLGAQAPGVPNRPAGVSDALLARSVLKAMDADPELRGVNLVVSVVDGVAVVGGPVSSSAVAKRVEFVVKGVPDIKEVKNCCFVTPGPDPMMRAVAEKMGSSLPPRPAWADVPGAITGQPSVLIPPLGSQNLVATGSPRNPVVVRKPADGPDLLGAPVGPAGSGPAAVPAPVKDSTSAPGTAPVVLAGSNGVSPASNAADILTSAGNVKKVEARFARLTIELRDGVIQIGGTAPRASDAWDLADKLRQIPGVSRVVIAATADR